MSKAGCPYDNAPMERFYNTFKSNFYNVTSFSNVEMMDELTTKYINWYNYVRHHSHNNYLTPMEARYKQVFIEQSVTKKIDQYNMAESGVMVTGWLNLNGTWYYMGNDGAMLTGTHIINGNTYVFNQDGVWISD